MRPKHGWRKMWTSSKRPPTLQMFFQLGQLRACGVFWHKKCMLEAGRPVHRRSGLAASNRCSIVMSILATTVSFVFILVILFGINIWFHKFMFSFILNKDIIKSKSLFILWNITTATVLVLCITRYISICRGQRVDISDFKYIYRLLM